MESLWWPQQESKKFGQVEFTCYRDVRTVVLAEGKGHWGGTYLTLSFRLYLPNTLRAA
jgi:hypothetical protein